MIIQIYSRQPLQICHYVMWSKNPGKINSNFVNTEIPLILIYMIVNVVSSNITSQKLVHIEEIRYESTIQPYTFWPRFKFYLENISPIQAAQHIYACPMKLLMCISCLLRRASAIAHHYTPYGLEECDIQHY